MQRTMVNPWTWSAELGYSQGAVVSGSARTLYCSGQAAMDAAGSPGTPGTWRRSWR
jgi:enamine deaminase RidA (YjgF/YER057c/UK114 family)